MSHTHTAICPPDRNPDVRIGIDPMPADCFLFEGKLLPQRAKTAGIPYGVATKWVPSGKAHRWETQGLIIRKTDRKRMELAAVRKGKRHENTSPK